MSQAGDFMEFRANQGVEGEQEALSRLSESEFHAGSLVERQSDQMLSEAKSEMIMQESRAERSDDVIRESNRQIHSHRMGINHKNQECEEASRREQA